MERARTEWLRDLGIGQHALKTNDNLMFVVSTITIDYKKPAILDDELTVQTDLLSMRSCSIDLKQQIFRKKELLTNSIVTVACIDANQLKPVKIPTTIKKLMELL
ncbi:hypothetical protein MB2181_01690 [Methylophilales bacterium HTCC2181]|uniref:Uncharacterized protein n=1 Tax=Methylophilales bacterium HTCC2181 TaxID=383631 RepID=A0P5D5_9PROT|nr:hypothetical protein MB2181_01690 [Methylophilales bacterium HTCC2181]